jgi:hypothetical protein
MNKPDEEPKPEEPKAEDPKPDEPKPEAKKPADEKPAEDKPPQDKPAEKPKDEKPAQPSPEKPGEKPSEKPAEEEKPGKKPDQPELPRQRLQPPKPKLELGEPGKIRKADVNREIASAILGRWRSASGASAGLAGKALRMESEIRRGERAVGTQLLIAAGDGRVRAEYEIDGKRTVVIADGTKYWLTAPGKAAAEVTSAKAILDPHFAQAAVLGSLLAEAPLVRWGELALEGSDKAGGRLCYRLAATDPSSEQLFVWLTVYGPAGTPQIELVKSGVGTDDDEPIPSTLYSDFKSVEGISIPQRRTLVTGLAETPQLEMVTTKCELLTSAKDEEFKQPE